jgi:hypothetical protein
MVNGACGLDSVGHGLDPYTASGEQVMAQIDALIAAGKVLDSPVV